MPITIVKTIIGFILILAGTVMNNLREGGLLKNEAPILLTMVGAYLVSSINH